MSATSATATDQPARTGLDEVSVQVGDPRVMTAVSGWASFQYRMGLHPVWDLDLLRVEAWTARNPPLLAVVRRRDRVVGALCLMLCRGWRDQSYAPPPGVRTRRSRPRWAEAYLPLMSGHPAVVFDAELDVPARAAAIRAVERELVRHVGFGLLGVVYRALPDELLPAVSGRLRPARRIDPVAVLRSEWSTVDEWTAALPDRHPARRAPAARAGSLLVSSGTARTDLDPAQLTAILNRQRARNDERAWADGQPRRLGGLRMDTRTPIACAYLDRLVRRPDVHTTTYTDLDGRLAAFGMMIDHPVTVDMHHWAAEPDTDPALHADFFHRCVRHLIEHRRTELTAGRGQLDAKAELGFGRRELSTVATPRVVLGR